MRARVTFSLTNGWEDWIIDIPNELVPDDGDFDEGWLEDNMDLVTQYMVSMEDAGNNGYSVEEVELLE